jgi:hypothetical protein
MKVWADLSTIFKIAFVCVVVGFLLGLCASGAVPARSPARMDAVALSASGDAWRHSFASAKP